MKNICLVFLLFLSVFYKAWGQCPLIDFSAPATSCKNEYLTVTNTTATPLQFEWDFCDGSILNTPTAFATTISLASEVYDMKPVIENDIYYAFILNVSNGKVLRLNYGTSVYNTPAITDLGNFGIINQPLGIDFWNENDKAYALVSTNDGSLFLLDFGTSVSNIPNVTAIPGLSGLGNHRQVKIVEESGKVLALIAGGGSNRLSIINFGSSITNTPTQFSIDIPNASTLIGVDFKRYCNKSFVLLSGYSSGLHLLNFGTSLFNTPVATQCSSINSLLGLSILDAKNNFYALVSSQAQGIIRFDFGADMNNATPTPTVLGKFGSMSFSIGFSVIKHKSKYYAFGINNDNSILTILDFPKDCDNTDSYENVISPTNIAYNKPGNYSIKLTEKGLNDEFNVISKNITVQNISAPVLIIRNDNSCVSSEISFTAEDQGAQSLSNIIWDFGDGANGSNQNATHQYNAAGTYSITLEAEADNGCSNRVIQNVSIFNEPVAGFKIPDFDPFCTNQLYTFENESAVDSGSTPFYQWKVNDAIVSSAKDLSYAFSTNTAQKITLVSTIPGCSDEVEKIISNLSEGPIADFTYTGNCEGDTYNFTNNTQGDVNAYEWNFNDGPNSTETNPQHIFSDIGGYDVTITAYTVNGCNNTLTQKINVNSKPKTKFRLELPPYSCNGSDSYFVDETENPIDSNLDAWLWTFNDAGSSENTSTLKDPTHVYAVAKKYNVSLKVTTDLNCSTTIEDSVTISQAPQADFTNTPLCKNQLVTFTPDVINALNTYYWEIGNTIYTKANPTHTFVFSGSIPIKLTVTAENKCESRVSRSITVNDPIVPNFLFTKNCDNQNTIFTSDTYAGDDLVTEYKWKFPEEKTGSPTTFTFANTGNFDVTLKVTTQSGCSYSRTKKVAIIKGPSAMFNASSYSGVPPLNVNFTNTSLNTGIGSSFLWTFSDDPNSTTSNLNPNHTFKELGEYVVDLKATDSIGCSSTLSKVIMVAVPFNDVSIVDFTIVEDTVNTIHTFKGIATLRNNGNLVVNKLKISLDLSGNIIIRENVAGPILPKASYKHTISFDILKTKELNYICAELQMEKDSISGNNRICTSFSEQMYYYDVYPNPVVDELHIEWISKNSNTGITVKLLDGMGKEVLSNEFSSVTGYNEALLPVYQLSSGMYILSMQTGSDRKLQRIAITSN